MQPVALIKCRSTGAALSACWARPRHFPVSLLFAETSVIAPTIFATVDTLVTAAYAAYSRADEDFATSYTSA